MTLTWVHEPAHESKHLYWSESYQGFAPTPDGHRLLIVTIHKEDDTWLITIDDSLTPDEFFQVHAKLQEILSSGIPPA